MLVSVIRTANIILFYLPRIVLQNWEESIAVVICKDTRYVDDPRLRMIYELMIDILSASNKNASPVIYQRSLPNSWKPEAIRKLS